MVDRDKILKIPPAERQTITPELRAKLITEIFAQYKVRFDTMKMIYGLVNHDSTIPVDYAAIFRVMNSNRTMALITIDVGYAFSDRSTPGYRWCKIHQKEDDYFKEISTHMAAMPEERFYQFVVNEMGLSLDKNDEMYWKKEKFVPDLLKAISDLYLKFKKPQPPAK